MALGNIQEGGLKNPDINKDANKTIKLRFNEEIYQTSQILTLTVKFGSMP